MKKEQQVRKRNPTPIWLGRPPPTESFDNYYSVLSCWGKPEWSRTGYLRHPRIGMGSAMTVCPGLIHAAGIHLRKGQIVKLKVSVVPGLHRKTRKKETDE